MPRSPERVERLIEDGLAAALALGHGQIDVAGLAVGLLLVDVVANLV